MIRHTLWFITKRDKLVNSQETFSNTIDYIAMRRKRSHTAKHQSCRSTTEPRVTHGKVLPIEFVDFILFWFHLQHCDETFLLSILGAYRITHRTCSRCSALDPMRYLCTSRFLPVSYSVVLLLLAVLHRPMP